MVIDAAAPYLPELHASYAHAVAMFETLPPRPQIVQGVLCEKQMGASIAAKLKAVEKERPGSWRTTWKAMLAGEDTGALANVKSFDELIQIIDKFQLVYDELGQLATLPPREFDAKDPAFVERANAASPVAKLLLPAMDKVMKAQRHSEVRMAMLLAGLAVIEDGPEKRADIKDPFGDGPFGYRKLEKGFELSSKLQQDGKPVTLTIGQAPAEPADSAK
jgi:hypothetical protein